MSGAGKTIWEFAKTLVMAVGVAWLASSLVEPTVVSGNSMYPTIESKNYMLLSPAPYLAGTPKYGDIVVFNSHVYMEDGREKDFIKRVIGLPGDTIRIREGYVYRNGKKLREDYINGGRTPGIMEAVTVEAGRVFVLGDNRGDSRDSRDPSIGQIALEDIVGKAVFRLYPFDKMGRI